jgi:RNA polymerase sigma factor (sigma-70 family)
MDLVLSDRMTDQDQRLTAAFERDRGRLRNFIRSRVPDTADAEDVLQDVFFELVEAYRLTQPIEQVTAWLFEVARNRITDLFRRRSRESQHAAPPALDDESRARWAEDLLPSPDAGPEAAYARSVLAAALDDALDELPDEQREVFVAHELLGFSFKEIAARTGENVNTLLGRKHYAVLHLRRRLQSIHDKFR